MTQKNIEELRTIGATSFPFFTQEDCEHILAALLKTHTLVPAQRIVGKRKVEQYFSEATISTRRVPSVSKRILLLEKHIVDYSTTIAGEDIFESLFSFQEVRLQKYEAGTQIGISPHYDHRAFRNLVVSVLLRGDSCFYVYEHENAKPREIIAGVGYCILLRAPGLFKESKSVLHSVQNVKRVRFSLGLRQGCMLP